MVCATPGTTLLGKAARLPGQSLVQFLFNFILGVSMSVAGAHAEES